MGSAEGLLCAIRCNPSHTISFDQKSTKTAALRQCYGMKRGGSKTDCVDLDVVGSNPITRPNCYFKWRHPAPARFGRSPFLPADLGVARLTQQAQRQSWRVANTAPSARAASLAQAI